MKIALFLLFFSVSLFSAKIEGEIFFRYYVPNGKAKEIFSFLRDFDFKKVLVEDWEALSEKDSYIVKYFDTSDLKLLKEGFFCALREYNKRDKVVVCDNLLFKTKIYKKQRDLRDKHPLFSLIKRKERPLFQEELKKIGVDDVLMLKNIFNLRKLEWRIVILKDNQIFATLTLQESILKDLPFAKEYFQLFLKREKGEISKEDQAILQSISSKIDDSLKSRFSFLKRLNCKNDYQCDFEYFDKHYPFFKLAVKEPLLYYLLYIFSAALFFALAAFLIFKIIRLR